MHRRMRPGPVAAGIVTLALAGLLTPACSEDPGFEEAGEQIDEALGDTRDGVGDAMDDAADDMDDALDEAGDTLDDAMDDAAETAEEATEDLDDDL